MAGRFGVRSLVVRPRWEQPTRCFFVVRPTALAVPGGEHVWGGPRPSTSDSRPPGGRHPSRQEPLDSGLVPRPATVLVSDCGGQDCPPLRAFARQGLYALTVAPLAPKLEGLLPGVLELRAHVGGDEVAVLDPLDQVTLRRPPPPAVLGTADLAGVEASLCRLDRSSAGLAPCVRGCEPAGVLPQVRGRSGRSRARACTAASSSAAATERSGLFAASTR